MCFVSMVMDQWWPYIPQPSTTGSSKTTTVSYPPAIPQYTLDELKELLEAFREAVEAAKVLDRLTGQPDCISPTKASLLERVERLEKELGI
jgi:hypothetical protein